jgi:hypothetical protein
LPYAYACQFAAKNEKRGGCLNLPATALAV